MKGKARVGQSPIIGSEQSVKEAKYVQRDVFMCCVESDSVSEVDDLWTMNHADDPVDRNWGVYFV